MTSNADLTHSFQCMKCQHQEYSKDMIRATGDGFSRFFDVQNKRFTVITCQNCGFTEFYKNDVSKAGQIFDFLIGG